MPDLMSAALFEREGRALVAHRRRGPFAGQWMLPTVLVRDDEAAEDALRRHAREQFDMGLGDESFVETVYLTDPDDQRQYVANIFRAPLAGHMRFNAEGDYDDARWMGADELEGLWMPPDLRTPLAQILTHPESLHETDWSAVGGPRSSVAAGEGVPLAEREPPIPLATAPGPDNRAGWDAISAAYQDWYNALWRGGLMWTRGLYESELRVLGDVRGKRAIVLGCGGGQDCLALASMGAVAVGIDFSPEQIAYAKRHAGENTSFVEGSVEDLSSFDDESFDLALSIHALGFVERVSTALHEAARILRRAGVLAICVPHPWNQVFSDLPPYCTERSYWTQYLDWNYDNQKFGDEGRLRDYRRTIGEWFDLITTSGFAVERMIEPYQGDLTGTDTADFNMERAKLMPQVLIVKARKR